jgi:tRNA nucleotidyltransferase (CCA-adding enzyme)
MYEQSLNILNMIFNHGYEAYIIGGYPRDKYLNINSNDIDICTNAPIELLESLFDIKKYNNSFANVVIKYNGYDFEITHYRKDYYDKSRYPKIEYVNTLKEDLQRRDFIINTLCINHKGEYIDILGAKEDIDKKVINTVKDADTSFKEDPLRILRAIRFSISLNMTLSNDIKDSIRNNYKLLKNISNVSIKKELDKIPFSVLKENFPFILDEINI